MSKKRMETLETNEPVIEKVKKPGFIKEFGRIFSEFGNLGKEKVQEEMLKIFPNKSETIEKWTEWYKAYYNMGKIKGFSPDESQRIHWKKVA